MLTREEQRVVVLVAGSTRDHAAVVARVLRPHVPVGLVSEAGHFLGELRRARVGVVVGGLPVALVGSMHLESVGAPLIRVVPFRGPASDGAAYLAVLPFAEVRARIVDCVVAVRALEFLGRCRRLVAVSPSFDGFEDVRGVIGALFEGSSVPSVKRSAKARGVGADWVTRRWREARPEGSGALRLPDSSAPCASFEVSCPTC